MDISHSGSFVKKNDSDIVDIDVKQKRLETQGERGEWRWYPTKTNVRTYANKKKRARNEQQINHQPKTPSKKGKEK
jgi:hypothetical protein